MTRSRRVGLVFGGRSVEHEVSVVSARGVAAAMAQTAHVCVPLAVTRSGQWLSPAASASVLASEARAVEVPASERTGRVYLDPGGGGLAVAAGPGVEPIGIDLVFPLIHGWGGEDGRLQGALELAGIPYVGSGVAGSAVGMDKALAKRVFEAEGIPVGPWCALDGPEWRASRVTVLQRIEDLGYPVFVKPSNGGSSVGITRVRDRDGVVAAVEAALEHDRDVVVERGIDAREIECAVLGNDRPEASGLGEIEPSREFYDYAAKYEDGTSKLILPAPLMPEQAERIRRLAVRAFRALRLRGLARVDFLVDRTDGTAYLNEVNTLPGFTPISMFAKLWEAEGLPYPALVERLVDLAEER